MEMVSDKIMDMLRMGLGKATIAHTALHTALMIVKRHLY